MHFKNIKLKEWQQFQNIDIDFHKRLTILTGANASGKTTILNLLAKHCNWDVPSVGTPISEKITGAFKYLYRLFNGRDKSDQQQIGTLKYGNGTTAVIKVPTEKALQYNIEIPNKQPVECFYIPSHGSIFVYQRLDNIPAARKNKSQAFNELYEQYRTKYFGGGGRPPSFYMKNTLLGWMIQGYGVKKGDKPIMPEIPEQISYYEGFQDVLKRILPKSLGFSEFEIRDMEIVFVCNDGRDNFVFEAASGGISALIDIAWQIYMFSTKERGAFTVMIDEIENHLHPTMQRQILPDLLDAFPKVRFIVATHNPLIVGSVRDSSVYVLKYNEANNVISEKLDFEKRPKTALEILDEVLGVSFTMPIWAEVALENIVKKYVGRTMHEADFNEMRKELGDIGLERLMPGAIQGVVRGGR